MQLFNQVIASFAQPEKGLANYNRKMTKRARYNFIRTRQELIGAQKFSVSSSLLSHVDKAASVNPKSLLEMIEIGKPCFENMWVEGNINVLKNPTSRVNLSEDFDSEKTTRLVGWHIRPVAARNVQSWGSDDKEKQKQLESMSDAYEVTFFATTDNREQVYAAPFDLFIGQQNLHGGVINFFDRIGKEKPLLFDSVFKGQLLGKTYLAKHNKKLLEIFKDEPQAKGDDVEFTDAGNIFHEKVRSNLSRAQIKLMERLEIYPNALDGVITPHDFDTACRSDDNEQVITKTFYCCSFMNTQPQMIIALLALLNYPHIIYETDKPNVSDRTIHLGRKLPQNEVKVLEIDLPKPRGVTQYERMFKNVGNPKRRHVRRGHWRTLRLKSGDVITKWIAEQWVGNAELGTIINDYHLLHKYKRSDGSVNHV